MRSTAIGIGRAMLMVTGIVGLIITIMHIYAYGFSCGSSLIIVYLS